MTPTTSSRSDLPHEVAASAERIAAKLLRRSELPPGSPATAIARSLGHTIEHVPRLPGEARGGVDPETRAILLAPCAYQPRLELTTAHELCEMYLRRGAVPKQWHEAACQRGAAALLMPRGAFVASANSCNLHVPTLAKFWPHCSREAILTRIADLFPNTVASSWRGNRARFRRSHSGYQQPALATQLEEFVAAEAAFHGRESWVREGSIAARAWPALGGRALVLCVAT